MKYAVIINRRYIIGLFSNERSAIDTMNTLLEVSTDIKSVMVVKIEPTEISISKRD